MIHNITYYTFILQYLPIIGYITQDYYCNRILLGIPKMYLIIYYLH